MTRGTADGINCFDLWWYGSLCTYTNASIYVLKRTLKMYMHHTSIVSFKMPALPQEGKCDSVGGKKRLGRLLCQPEQEQGASHTSISESHDIKKAPYRCIISKMDQVSEILTFFSHVSISIHSSVADLVISWKIQKIKDLIHNWIGIAWPFTSLIQF